MVWHRKRFEKREGMIEKPCAECGIMMYLPPSKAEEYKRCGPVCNQLYRERKHDALNRPCQTCGAIFRPRPNQLRMGHGKFCSQQCNTAGRKALLACDIDVRKAGITKARAEGRWTILRGPDKPNWKGGEEAWKARKKAKADAKTASGEAARELREYRKNNPDKVREFASRRAGRKLGRLEYGCLPRIRKAQGDRCAICCISLKGKGHMDHMMPLARGGKHEAANIQFLCQSCNLAKSDRDPVTHMQSLGRLL